MAIQYSSPFYRVVLDYSKIASFPFAIRQINS